MKTSVIVVAGQRPFNEPVGATPNWGFADTGFRR
jgi:hypothetical protein